MKRIIWLVPLLALAALAGYYHHWPRLNRDTPRHDPLVKYKYLDGRQDAEMALARGRLVILSSGKPAHWWPEYRDVLKRDYAIDLRAVARCIVSDELNHYIAAYNEVMERRIGTTLGDRVFPGAQKKAEALHLERHPPLTPHIGTSQP